jgi:hypothetical protein
MEVVVDRVAGLDVHKDTVIAAVRVPGPRGGRQQTIRQFRSYTRDLGELRDWLRAERVTLVVMEATGVYWRPVWHLLEEVSDFQLELVNAHHVKRVPGRKTDVADAAWLAQLAECGLLRGSFVPPPTIAHLRDLTRYRKKLIADRAKEGSATRSCWRTPASSWTPSSPTSSASRHGTCSTGSSLGSPTPRPWPTMHEVGCGPRCRTCGSPLRAGSASITTSCCACISSTSIT